MDNKFNPDINIGNSIFGLPNTPETAVINIIPVSWDATTSYGKGASKSPEAIYNASFQLDLYKEFYPNFYKHGIAMIEQNMDLMKLNDELVDEINEVVKFFNSGMGTNEAVSATLADINKSCSFMNKWVYNEAIKIINNNKYPIVLGGDHSVPLGLIKALSESHQNFSILHIDAHADLRKEYQGFTYSHASIMYNALNFVNVSNITQVGIRDYCYEEEHRIRNSHNRILSFTDKYLQNALFEGRTWLELTSEIINTLQGKVYISFDIDGLDPKYCPSTGTPVPGGPSFEQISYLLEAISESGRKIIGADLCEVVPNPNNEWDANVGARALLQLCMVIIYSNLR